MAQKRFRVPKGETFWFVSSTGKVMQTKDEHNSWWDYNMFKSGNYFATKEEAEAMAIRLRAVLNGAVVIETPSEEEIEIASKEYNNGSLPNDFDYRNGFKDGVFYLESKIVK